jgi:hypothetical protein
MTATRAEFYNFICGFRMGLRNSISCGRISISDTDFTAIIGMMGDVIDAERAAAKAANPIPTPSFSGWSPIPTQPIPAPDDAADNVPTMTEHTPIIMGGGIIMGGDLNSDTPPAGWSGPTPQQYAANLAEGIDPTVDVMAPTDTSSSDGSSSSDGGGDSSSSSSDSSSSG